MRAFKFTPLLKSMIWGGNRIASYKGIAVDRSDIGESWELSGVKGDESVVAEGEYAGMTLPELIGQLKGELVGACRLRTAWYGISAAGEIHRRPSGPFDPGAPQ